MLVIHDRRSNKVNRFLYEFLRRYLHSLVDDIEYRARNKGYERYAHRPISLIQKIMEHLGPHSVDHIIQEINESNPAINARCEFSQSSPSHLVIVVDVRY